MDMFFRPSSFWTPHYERDSAWIEHAPFAFWLMDVLRPRVFVELGTHGGFSYFSFCQAVSTLNTGTRCFAVDHWKGDEHSGYYGENVYQSVTEWNLRYAGFSSLVRATFEEAAHQFKDGSVDLLHLDGRHFYEDIKQDFAAWESKLSEHAVILFHDTNVRERQFGVWRFFDELRSSRMSFEFLHGYGLGILAWGNVMPEPLRRLFELPVSAAAELQSAYARLGSSLMDINRLRHARELLAQRDENIQRQNQVLEKLNHEAEVHASEHEQLIQFQGMVRDQEKTIASQDREIEKQKELVDRLELNVSALQAGSDQWKMKADQQQVENRQLRMEVGRLDQELHTARLHIVAVENDRQEHRVHLAALGTEADILRARLHSMEQSRTWRLTRPFRVALVKGGMLFREYALGRKVNPFFHALVAFRLVSRSGLFDPVYYRQTYPSVARSRIPPILHYLVYGWREGKNPHPLFDTCWYREQYPDVAANGVHPLVHYLRKGWREGKDPHPLFVTEYYLANHPEVESSGLNPLVHFVLFGANEGRNPNPLFDINWYRSENPEAAITGLNPLVHYLTIGREAGLNPGPSFDVREHTERFPDIAQLGIDPLSHALGQARGKLRRAPEQKTRVAAWEEAVSRFAQTGVTLRVVYIGGEPDTPGYHYRVIRYAEASARIGAQTLVLRLDEAPSRLSDIAAADILVIWRAAWDARVEQVVLAARNSGTRIVFDVDDLMFEPELAKVGIIDGIRSQGFREEEIQAFYGLVRHTLLLSDFATAPTRELSERLSRAGKPVWTIPNGYDAFTFKRSRLFVRRRSLMPTDGLIRLGYAAGSRTHQKDFALCADAVARILREHPECRLVLFRSAAWNLNLLDVEEYSSFTGLEDQIEWRNMVTLPDLPEELARFDINLAPLETGNRFCEAKSELKYFEAALAGVCTVASPTGPFQRAILNGQTGFLASNGDWYEILKRLVSNASLRKQTADAAHLHVLWPYGPECRVEHMASLFEFLRGGRGAARTFALEQSRPAAGLTIPEIPETDVMFMHDRLCASDVTVIIPLHNYEMYVEEALESVRAQTLSDLDLVVIDDASTDRSLEVVINWAEAHKDRFNRLLVLRNRKNSKLGPTRNAGFHAAETPYVLALDADNRLRPRCAQACLDVIQRTGSSFVYPVIQRFGNETTRMGDAPFDPVRLAGGNYIDAMALVAKSAWVWAGGYDHVEFGWEDYDFWCRLTARGLSGHPVGGEPLADYRVHSHSMLHRHTNIDGNYQSLVRDMKRRHPWLAISEPDPKPEA